MNEKKPTSCRLSKPAIIVAFLMVGIAMLAIIFTLAIPGLDPGPTGSKETGKTIEEVVGITGSRISRGLEAEQPRPPAPKGFTINETEVSTERGPADIVFLLGKGESPLNVFFIVWSERIGLSHRIVGALTKVNRGKIVRKVRIIAEDLRGPFLPTPKIISLPTYAPNDAIVVWDETNLIYAARIDIDPQILDFISTCEPFWPPQGDESTESPSRGFVKNPNIAVDGSTILLSWEFVQWDMGAESPTLRLKSDIFLKAFDLGLQPDEDFPLFRPDALNISNTLYGSSNIFFNNDLANPEFWITYGHKNPDTGLLTNITGLSYPTQMGEDNR